MGVVGHISEFSQHFTIFLHSPISNSPLSLSLSPSLLPEMSTVDKKER